MAGTIGALRAWCPTSPEVSMESGLDGRNNHGFRPVELNPFDVSMESGLDGRNNTQRLPLCSPEDDCLNGVRPRWPEQFHTKLTEIFTLINVSMESGLDGRNNAMDIGEKRRLIMSQWSPA